MGYNCSNSAWDFLCYDITRVVCKTIRKPAGNWIFQMALTTKHGRETESPYVECALTSKQWLHFWALYNASWHLWCHVMSCDVMWHVHGYNASWHLSLYIKISSLALRSSAITVSYPDPMWHVDRFWNQALLLVLARVPDDVSRSVVSLQLLFCLSLWWRYFCLTEKNLVYAKNKGESPLCVIPSQRLLAVERVDDNAFGMKFVSYEID